MSIQLNNIKIKESNSNSFGNIVDFSTVTTQKITSMEFRINQREHDTQSTPVTTLSAAEFKSLDRKFAVTSSKITPNRLLKLQVRAEKKSKHIEQIRQNVARKVQEHKELTAVVRNAKKKRGTMHDSVQNINQILKKPGMDIPRSIITRLMFEPSDYVIRYNYPKYLDTFTTSLYKCSPDAYKLIQETFGNVLPTHSKV